MKIRTTAFSVLGSGIAALILSMGIARFAYTPMIPYMQAQTGMGEALAGWLAGWNYLGYMTGVLIVARLWDFILKDRLYRIGLILAVVTTPMMGLSESPIVWGISRYLAGLSTAAVLMLGSGLILHWLMREGQRSELGLHFSGIGIGIVVGALLLEWSADSLSWREQWYALGIISLLMFFPAWLGLPKPEKIHSHSIQQEDARESAPTFKWLSCLHIAYFCSGFAYVIYATFIVVIAEQQPLLAGKGVWLWVVVGVVAAPSAIIWDRVARKFGYVSALQLAFGIKIVALLLPVLSGSLWLAMLSAAFFGGTFVGIVSLVLTMVGVRYPSIPAQIMAKLTISFCIAQIVGPVLAGELAERSGYFNSSLLLAIVIMILGLFSLQMMKSNR